ncbi:MAG: hypothetical protein HRF40_06265 [Nitrososphaera sp.]
MVSDAFLLVIACIGTAGLILTVSSNVLPSDPNKVFESLPQSTAFGGTDVASSEASENNPTVPTVAPREDCIMYEATGLRYIKSKWQCSAYFAEVTGDGKWCFAGIFNAFATDMFNQSSLRSYATVAKYVHC